MADKRISDLDITTSLEQDTLFLVRKTNQNEDFKITTSNLVKTIGNPIVAGFFGISSAANKIQLFAVNQASDAFLDKYYEGMVISFISPIGSTASVTLKLSNLEYKNFKTDINQDVKLEFGKFYEAIYKDGLFVQINGKISDLTTLPNDQLNADDLFLIRRTSANKDYKLTKSVLVNNLSNPAIFGFNAVSETTNKITLTPLNGANIPGYLNGMKISFISPITNTGNVQIKIGNNIYVDLKPNIRTLLAELSLGQYYEAYYKDDKFLLLSELSKKYTNEYNGSATIAPDKSTTTYALFSVTKYYKDAYYLGMSVLFTSKVNSEGLVYLNIDSLGSKLLSDPDGDGAPFSLVENQTIMAIYDGTKFIKNSFTMKEPEVPFTEITINVGPTQIFLSNRALQSAYDQIVKDYGHEGGGRQVTIQFDNDYTGEGLSLDNLNYNTGYIKIVGNPNIQMKLAVTPFGTRSSIFFAQYLTNEISSDSNVVGNAGTLKLTGNWKITLPSSSDNTSYSFIELKKSTLLLDFQNIIIENQNNGTQNFPFITSNYKSNLKYISTYTTLNFNNVEIINFGFFNRETIFFSNSFIYNLIFTNNITPLTTKISKQIFRIVGVLQVDGLNINVDNPSNYSASFIVVINSTTLDELNVLRNTSLSLKNCNIILNQKIANNRNIFATANSDQMSVVLENCVIKYLNTVENAVESLRFTQSSNRTLFKILGSDFRNKNTSTIADIVTDKAELFVKTSTTLGSTAALNGGKITVITE